MEELETRVYTLQEEVSQCLLDEFAQGISYILFINGIGKMSTL